MATSIMDFFNRSSAPPPAPSPDNNSNSPSPAPGPNPPAPSPAPNAPAPAPVDPMSVYAKMWDNPTNQETAPTFNIDPKVMDDIASRQDFTQGINPDVLAKATGGDAAAMMELLKHVGQQSYKAALSHNSTLTDRFVDAREKFNEKNVNNRVRGELTDQSLGSIPNAKNPVVRQQLRETAERLQRQNPDASPQEIANMTKQYFNDLLSAINPQTQADPRATAKQETANWDSYFDADASTDDRNRR